MTRIPPNIHSERTSRKKVHVFRAWAIRACFTNGLLGGNQSLDKHRMVPPFYIMKRVFLLLSILFSFVSSNAQFIIEPAITVPEDYDIGRATSLSVIPKDFCKGNVSCIIIQHSDYIIYDNNFSRICSIDQVKGQPKELTYIDFDEGSFYNDAVGNNRVSKFKFTQTLFNDDEKFEYISADYLDENDTNTWGTYVFNEEGNAIEKLDIEGELKLIVKISGQYYLVTGSTPYRFYRINRDLSTNLSSSAKKDIKKNNAIYNLNGHKIDKVTTGGIYIQNGEKVILRKK